MSRTGYIYKLVCDDVEIKECYVGSTTNMKVRKACHKRCCNTLSNKNFNNYLYQFIRENGGFQNWDMIQIEEFQFNNRRELDTKERYWLEQLNATLNRQIPTRTNKEWYIDNKEKYLGLCKEYRNNNPETIKKWREINKERLIKHDKEYYTINKEKILEKQKQLIECDCGATIRKGNLLRHNKKSKKHIFYEKFRDYIHN